MEERRKGEVDQLFLANGNVTPIHVTAPIAAYRHKSIYSWKKDNLILIQHGSYLIADINSQPEIERGEVILYRGIQKTEIFKLYRLRNPETRLKLWKAHEQTLVDSVDSFNAVHCNVARSETGFLNDRNWMFSEIASKLGLQPKDEATNSLLYSGFALEEWCGKNKFGPNFIKFRTPATNIRITTFVCNETEAKVIDPNKLEVVEAVGCTVQEIEV